MNSLDTQYKNLVTQILTYGTEKTDRTGTGTLSIFDATIRHRMSDGFPLLTCKSVHFKSVVVELLWFLKGRTDIDFLHRFGCKIWDGDYKKSGRTDGNFGPIYGAQWRNFFGVDQITSVIQELKVNPDSRRLFVSAWNPRELPYMVLPPCHTNFQFYSHEKDGKRFLSLKFGMRSNDVGLGLPFNLASYGLLLEIVAAETKMIPYELIYSGGDVHIYKNHLPDLTVIFDRPTYELPKLKFSKVFLNLIDSEISFDFKIDTLYPEMFLMESYQNAGPLKLPLSN